jgi:MFS family permease
MADRSLIFLGLVATFYFFSSAITGVFLPNYYLQIGLNVNHIIVLTGTIMIILGLVPIITLRFFSKAFERLLSVGIVLDMVFLASLAFVKDPLILGLVEGLSFATFWPAFNLLIFRFTGLRQRGLVVSLIYVIIPMLIGLIGPAFGGALIHFLSFDSLFFLGIVSLIFSLVFSLKIDYKPVSRNFYFPKKMLFLFFGLIVVVWGFADASYIAYPLFLHSITGGFLEMGIVASVLSIIIAAVSFAAGKISEVGKHRISFTLIGLLMNTLWFVAIAFVSTVPQLMMASIFSGLSGAFAILLFSLYGDFFKRKYHALLVVFWEVFLMFGRLANLIPAYIFLQNFDFSSYFLAVGLISLLGVVLFSFIKLLHHKQKIAFDSVQRTDI